jgi:hypothetical protein
MKEKNSNIKKKKNKWGIEKIIKEKIKKNLIKKYNKPIYFYNIKVIDDIIYNEKTHFVEAFKEYLLYEDDNEFLIKFYSKKETSKRLKRILTFYDKYSRIYANYTAIPESKYMYKNIKRKQKMIDQMKDSEETEESYNSSYHTIFTKNVMNSINSITKSIYNNESDSNNLSIESSLSLKKLINKLSIQEKRNKKENEIKFDFKRNNKNTDNKNIQEKIIESKKNLLSNNSSKKKMISALLSPKIKAKLIENNSKKNIKDNILKEKAINHKSIENNVKKNDKFLLSTNTNLTSKEFISKILSSPMKKSILKKNFPFHSPSFHNINKFNIKNLVFSPKNYQYENIQKIFSKNKNIKNISSNKINLNSSHKKSKSNPQSDDTRINNINIINNIQNGSTQINIYTGNDLYKSLNMNQGGSIFNSSLNLKSCKNSVEKIFENSNYIDKKKTIGYNFELNLKKIIQKNIELESSSSRRYNEKKNFFEKLGKYFFNKNFEIKDSSSISIKKYLNKSNSISKILINKSNNMKKNKGKLKNEFSCSNLKSNSYKKNLYSKINNNKISNLQNNFNTSKLKLKKLHDINFFVPKGSNDRLINSERNNKTNKFIF